MTLIGSLLDRILVERTRLLPIEVCRSISMEPLFSFFKDEGVLPALSQFPVELGHMIKCPRCQEEMNAFFEVNGLYSLQAEWLINELKM